MPPPPGYLRFVDLCEELDLSPNTVKKALREMEASGAPIKPFPSGTMKLYTPAQARAIRQHREAPAEAPAV